MKHRPRPAKVPAGIYLARLLALLLLPCASCSHKDQSAAAGDTGGPAGLSAASPNPQNPSPPTDLWREFSGKSAFEHVKRLADLGPRPSGSAPLETARRYITEAVQKAGWQIIPQKFVDLTPRGPVTFINLIARFSPSGAAPSDKTQRIIIGSHYDTKIFDTIRFVGADDGGSSTGALIELARVLALDPALAQQVELVFFDGEEAVVQFTELDGLYGSRYYAHVLRETGRNHQFRDGIVWDMIGPAPLDITIPPDSPTVLARQLFDSADTLGLRGNFSYFRSPILDDHTPLNESHIPTIDLIDFDFIYWHTADDTLDKISPESLQIVGQVTLHMLKSMAAR